LSAGEDPSHDDNIVKEDLNQPSGNTRCSVQ
jgi:hypothetical protein